jgi:hypothetical protein
VGRERQWWHGAATRVVRGRPALHVPESLEELTGPITGVVELPPRLDWSEQGRYDLSDPRQRNLMYEVVIRESMRVEDLRAFVHGPTLAREGATFARLAVSEPASGEMSTLELGVDLACVPTGASGDRTGAASVDAAANKLCALFGRAAVRDYIDVHGVLNDGRFTGPELLEAAVEHDPGFDTAMFTEALRAVTRLPASAFAPYKLTAEQVEALYVKLLAWAEEIEASTL